MVAEYKTDFQLRTDLNKYGENALLLYALELFFGIDDIDLVAASALTDDYDDKKCDLLYIDKDSGIVVIAQGYFSRDDTKKEAKANKASDLNTAASWLLSRDPEKLPIVLKSPGQELDSALRDDDITSIEFWYVHNLPESENVKKELDKVVETANALLRTKYPEAKVERVTVKEIGVNQLEHLYQGSKIPIIVKDKFDIHYDQGFTVETRKYKAFNTSVSGSWSAKAYSDYKTDLFSANVRDYLGSRKSQRNINHGIQETARNMPEDFFAYNNGLTAIVNSLTVDESNKILTINGLAIVNGAQTTGSISEVPPASLENLRVLIRFVQYYDKEIIENIIRYNNTQNAIAISDFRSNDDVQKRLRDEFGKLKGFTYHGARRGGSDSVIRRPNNLISSDAAAQAISSFHQDPGQAYNEKQSIWNSDKVYVRFFSEKTTAAHIIFCYTLLKTLERYKYDIIAIPEDERTETNKQQITLLRYRGSIYLMAAAIAACMEIILNKALPDKFRIAFKDDLDLPNLVNRWHPIIESTIPFVHRLSASLENGIKNSNIVKTDIDNFKSLVDATAKTNRSIFQSFADSVST